MGCDRIPKAVYEMMVEGRRKRGRRGTRWKASVLGTLVGYGLTEADAQIGRKGRIGSEPVG